MKQIPVSEVVVLPRQRKELTSEDVDNIASSFERYGQLEPILLNYVDEDRYELVAGFTRLQAAMRLGWDTIGFTFREDLDPIEAKEMELEENIRRKDLEWWEEAAAIAEIDALRRARDPDWNMRKTAELVGKSAGTVSQSVQLKKEMDENPDVRKEKTLVGALKKLDTKKKIEKRKADIERKKAGKLPSIPAEIVVGDAADLIREEPDESFDAIVTNFPFGVSLELKGGERPYHDEEDYIVQLVQEVVEESYRVLRDDSWFVGFFDVRKIGYSNPQMRLHKALIELLATAVRESPNMKEHIQDMISFSHDALGLSYWLEHTGFSYVTTLPAFWVKPNKTQGIIGDPRKGLITAYEAFVFAAKGDAVLLKQGRNNVFIYDSPTVGEKVHPLQMPTELCSEIIRMVSLGGGRILDPFAGSGSIGLGALTNQCEFKGYELDPEKASNGNLRLQEHLFAGERSGG